MKRSTIWLAGMFLFFAAVARGEFRYAITDLGTLGGTASSATAINNNGQVVGYSSLADGSTHAFLYSAGAMVDLGTLGGATSSPNDINDSGVVVGSSLTSSGNTQ